MPKPKIDITKLDQLLRSGKTQRECAQVFGVTESAVSKAKKQLKNSIVRTVALERANDVVESHIDMAAQLQKINRAINDELDRTKFKTRKAIGKDLTSLQDTIVKMAAEIRRQLETQLKIFEAWREWDLNPACREEVLQILDSFEPGVRENAIRKLKEAALLRGLVTIN